MDQDPNGMRRVFKAPPDFRGARGKSRTTLGGGAGVALPDSKAEISILLTGLSGWLLIAIRVALSAGVDPKAFAAAVMAPLVVMFFPLVAVGNFGKRGARRLAWVWALLVAVAVAWVWVKSGDL